MMHDEEKMNRRASLAEIRKHLRAGSALDMAEGQPYADGGANPSSEEAGVAQRIVPQHDVGGIHDQVSKDRGADMEQPSGHESNEGPRATEHSRGSGMSMNRTSDEHGATPSETTQRRQGHGWAEAAHAGDKDPHRHDAAKESANRATMDAKGRSAAQHGEGPPGRDRSNMHEYTMQEKPGYEGPGWREDGLAGSGAAEARSRNDAKGRTADGEPGDESEDKDLIAGLIHVAKKYKAP